MVAETQRISAEKSLEWPIGQVVVGFVSRSLFTRLPQLVTALLLLHITDDDVQA